MISLIISLDIAIARHRVGSFSFASGKSMHISSSAGNIHGCDFYMSKSQFEYWKHTQLTVDIVKGRGASFSLEIPLGIRFIIKSRLYSPDELNKLSPIRLASEKI
ncbi:DUF779 domain-containing protein [Zhouia spongiae]|uniref:DUF779 domain-containing protein n=1 Tax=Zhouia spongiae TaxID=2202721 RepID=A0ABY3YKB6_9FLAO|nr:DUF779 domain-containing protein [Zhouia spongiae]UNY98138.1 DUF779 domain-containing protein [Zhouia spongiae]